MLRYFNPQLHHLLNLLILLFVAKEYAYLYLNWKEIFFLLIFSAIFEMGLSKLFLKKVKVKIYSAFTTAIGIILMLYSTHLWLYLILIFLALAQKYLIKVQDRHIFNPSNFSIFILLLFFNSYGGVSAGTLGHSSYALILVIVLGIFILVRVNRWIIPLGFMIFYTLFEMLLIDQNTLIFEDLFERFYSVSFILFALFMVTDPLTTPKTPLNQTIFAILLSLSAALFDKFYGIRVEHIFLALTLISPITLLLEESKLKEFIMIEAILTVLIFFTLSKEFIFMGVPL
jgi:hypothetical protein